MADRLNLEDLNVAHLELTVTEARNGLEDETVRTKIETALDETQAYVFGGDHPVAYLVIKITRDAR
jgi:hypothetical protein